MAATIPTDEPTRLRAGDTWKWTRTLADYPAGTWVLKYRFKNAAGGFEIVASASGTDHAVTVAAATTGAYVAGSYQWMAWVESGSEKFTIDTGSAEVEADYRSGTATTALDDRSHARKMVDQIETWLEAHPGGEVEYEIAGRRMKYDKAGLIKLLDRYKSEVAKEDDAARLAAGLPSRRKLLVRFN